MSKLVFVLNCGSSSLKFAVIDAQTKQEWLSGIAECFFMSDARIKWKSDAGKDNAHLGDNAGHKEALAFIVDKILAAEPKLQQQLVAVGHRFVHGGEHYTHSVLIDEDVITKIKSCNSLAPLHNPANIVGYQAAQAAFPQLPQVAVFDTAFHQTMPEKAYQYALPQFLYRDHGVRRYGFHGTSHHFIAEAGAQALGKAVSQTNLISCHLGNGASVCAIKNGLSVDTSMGMTPLEGLVMGTRCGDVDPSIPFFIMDQLGYNAQQVQDLLNKESGLLGVSELTSDCRGIEDAAVDGHAGAQLALDMFCYRLAKQVAAYSVPLGRIDAIVFTGGIGENSDIIRNSVLQQLSIFGYQVDETLNLAARFGRSGIITKSKSPIAMVLPTNEEWMIAAQTLALS